MPSLSSLFGGTSADDPAVRDAVESFISDNDVAIFSKSWCSFSKRAMRSLDSQGIKYAAKEIDLVGDERATQKYLAKRIGKSSVTVPQIYVGGELVGGCDALLDAQSTGQLNKMLQRIKPKESL